MNSSSISLSEFYNKYKDWVCRNPQTASDVESSVKWLSYFIAGKINKSLVLTELIYSASNLLVLFNDIILQSAKQKLGTSAHKIKIWLSVLEYSEVFIEISSKSLWGVKGKWLVIVCVQLLKCAAKLILLLHYNEKIISSPAIMPCVRSLKEENNKTIDGVPRINNIAFSLKRSGRIIRKVDSAPPVNNRLWKPPSPSYYNNNNNNTILEGEPDKKLLQQYVIGEFLHIIKPVVNLTVMGKYGQSTWKPWMISAAMDLVSLFMLQSKPMNQPSRKLTQSQSLELSKRRLTLLLYLMRSPFYERHSKDRINSFLNSIARNIPLARLICTPIQQYLPHWQETYFYMWSS